jgi:hypothetical protein
LGTATDKKLTVILGQNRGFVKFMVLVSVYAIDWTWFEKEGQVSKGRKKLTITLLVFSPAGAAADCRKSTYYVHM